MRLRDFGSIFEKDGVDSITIADSMPTLKRVEIENVRILISSSSDFGTGEASFLRRRTGSFDGDPRLRIAIVAVCRAFRIVIEWRFSKTFPIGKVALNNRKGFHGGFPGIAGPHSFFLLESTVRVCAVTRRQHIVSTPLPLASLEMRGTIAVSHLLNQLIFHVI
jgi:hypothetical protein